MILLLWVHKKITHFFHNYTRFCSAIVLEKYDSWTAFLLSGNHLNFHVANKKYSNMYMKNKHIS